MRMSKAASWRRTPKRASRAVGLNKEGYNARNVYSNRPDRWNIQRCAIVAIPDCDRSPVVLRLRAPAIGCRIPRSPAPSMSAAMPHRHSVPFLRNYHRLCMGGTRGLGACLVEQHPQSDPDDRIPPSGRVRCCVQVGPCSAGDPGASPGIPPYHLDCDIYSDLRGLGRQRAKVAHRPMTPSIP